MHTIGISGQKRSGKDTIANFLEPYLSEINPAPWKRVAFAEPIRMILCQVFGVSKEWIEEWKVKDEIPPGWNMNVREALINIGDRFREIKTNCWIDLAMENSSINKLITDVRYEDELEKVVERGWVIRVCKPNNKTLNHITETALVKYDSLCLTAGIEGKLPDSLREQVPYHYFILNDGSLGDLERKVRDVMVPGLKASMKFFL